jgi:acyl-CoA dehydrogenase
VIAMNSENGLINMRADELLVETIDRLLAEHCTPERIAAAEGAYDHALWSVLEESGLTLVGVAEDRGGSGGTLHDAAAIMVASGYHSAPVPLADSLVAARLTAEDGTLVSSGIQVAISGRRVPWFEQSSGVMGFGDPSMLTIERTGTSYAGDPYVVLTSVPPANDVVKQQLALARSLQMAGALQRVSELCVQYAMEREQFGKPIGKQQILQHYLAQIAGEAVTAQAAADNAIDLMAVGADPVEITLAIAAAKVVSSRAVGSVNKLAHQLHGAIGYTDEHRLQLWTRRLWAWRDDFGTESEWGAVLGTALAGRGGPALWPLVTSWPPAVG